MTEPDNQKPAENADEERFFARGDQWDGAPVPDDYVDPEFADIEAAPGLLQPLLILLVIGFAGFLAWQYRGELAYAVSSSEPVSLGSAEDVLADDAFSGPSGLELPSNRLVSLEGIGIQRAVTGSREYRRLLGTHVYVQLDEPLPPAEEMTFGEFSEARGSRQIIGGLGRLVTASVLPKQTRSIFDYYSTRYGVRFCDIETPSEVVRYREAEKEAAILQFRDREGREPNDAELRELVGPDCYRAYLLQVGKEPADFRIYIAVYVGFAIVLIVSIMLLASWARRMRRAAS